MLRIVKKHLRALIEVGLLLPLLVAVQPAMGQQNNSSISGVVKDTTGSVIAGAPVKLTEPATGLARSTTTDGSGSYKFLALSPGSYDITVSQTGFKTFVASSFTLEVSQNAVQNATLQIGETTTAVTVEAAPPLVDTDSAVVGQVIGAKQVVTYPLNGRNFLDLTTLSAGVNEPSTSGYVAAQTGRSGLSIIVGGNRESSTSYLLDGIPMRDDRSGALIYQPTLDALQEFKVQRSFFQAEDGFHPSIVNVITKSGTNSFHGAAWDFLRNTGFDGSNYFSKTGPDSYHQNQFGLFVSGPIIKDRLLFLFDYEGRRSTQATTASGVYADEKQLSGDFSESTLANGNVIPIFDPAAPGRTQFPLNKIPDGRISGVAKQAIALLFPRGITTPSIASAPNVFGHPVTTGDDNQYIGRLDAPRVNTFGVNTQFMFRYALLDSSLYQPGLAPLQGLEKPINSKNIVFQATTVISPTVVNVFRIGYEFDNAPTDNIGAGSRNISAEVGLQNTTTFSPDWAAPVFAMTGFSSAGAKQGYNLVNRQNTYVLADNVTFIRGKHTFKTGIDLRTNRVLFDTGTYAFGSLTFSGPFTAQYVAGKAQASTGSPLADFLLGYPTSGSVATGSTLAHYRFAEYGFFFQDDWKAAQNLTIQAGLRYEPSTDPYSEEGNTYIFDQQNGTLLFPSLGEVPRGLLHSPHREFGPRLGMSFSPGSSGRTTIRAGVGTYFDMNQLNELQFANSGPPFSNHFALLQTGATITNAYQLDTNIFPAFAPQQPTPGFTPPAGVSLFTLDPNNKTPTIIQYNFNVQHQLGLNSMFQIGYFGSHAYHLSKRYNFNSCSSATDYLCVASRKPFPTYGYVFISSTRADSNYNSLQATFQQHITHGFTLLANYTYEKSLDTDSGEGGATYSTRAACISCDYGRSLFSVPQRFVASSIYELPIGRRKALGANMSPLANVLIGGWEVSGIYTIDSGGPFDIAATAQSGESEYSSRANCVSTNYYSAHHLHTDPNHQWLNPAAFAAPAVGTFGNCARDVVTGPGDQTLNAEAAKHFGFGDGRDIEFRAEAFNALNHTNFSNPAASVGSTTAPAGNFGRITSAGSARIIQLALKLKF